MVKITQKQKMVYEVDEDHSFDTLEAAREYVLEEGLRRVLDKVNCDDGDLCPVGFILNNKKEIFRLLQDYSVANI